MIVFSGIVHIIVAFVIWLIVDDYNLIMIVLGSLFPDTDTRKSIMGRILPLWVFFKHRGFIHTVWAMFIFTGLVYYLLDGHLATSFFIGYLSHLVIDFKPKRRQKKSQ